MNILEQIIASLPEESLKEITSHLIGDTIRRIPIDLPGRIALANDAGVNLELRFRISGTVDISHEEIAAMTGMTLDDVNNLRAVDVANNAPFVQPAMGKTLAVINDADAYAAQWPNSPWVPIVEEGGV